MVGNGDPLVRMKDVLQKIPLCKLASWPLLTLARWRRRQGWYDATTAQQFRWAAQLGGKRSTLAWLLFRRDLGHKLPRSWLREAALSPQLSVREKKIVQSLLAERSLHRAAPNDLAEVVWNGQSAWRQRLAEIVQRACKQEIWVVGNGPSVLGTRLGPRIDQSGMVVRFNEWGGAVEDIGARCDVWVRAPDLPFTPGVWDLSDGPARPAWVVLSGPDMQFRLEDWRPWRAWIQGGEPLLSVPLGVWRELVGQLQSPPSAGLLTLLWLRRLTGDWRGLKAVGFGYRGGIYHAHLPKHAPSKRHRWNQELEILNRWENDGLEFL